MFEDDSTGSFEKLEMRLKTPKRPLIPKVNFESKVPHPVKFGMKMALKKDDEEDKKVEQNEEPPKEQPQAIFIRKFIENTKPLKFSTTF
jgi:hypothetical protein